VVQVIFLDENSFGEEASCLFSHLVTYIEYSLLGRGNFRSQFSVIALVPQPQRTLQRGEKARL
jgi:hypothetical protein